MTMSDPAGTADAATFTPTLDDTLAAYRLFARPRARHLLLGFLVSAAIGLGLFATTDRTAMAFVMIVVPCLVGYWVILELLRVALLPHRVRRIHAQQKTLQEPTSIRWDKAGLTARSAHGISTTPWGDYVARRDDARVILLYHSDVLFRFIPRRALSAAQNVDLDDFIAKVPKKPMASVSGRTKHRGRPVSAALWLIAAAPAAASLSPARAAGPSSASATQTGPGGLLDRLRGSHDPVEQIRLIDAIGAQGAPGAGSPADVKLRLQGDAPALLLGIVRGTDDWSVRGEAMLALRDLDAPDDVVTQAIAAARADTGDHAGFLHGRTDLLQSWRVDRPPGPGRHALSPLELRQRATDTLKRQDIAVTDDALTEAIGAGKPDVVSSLLDAGLEVGPAQARRAGMIVLNGLTTACADTDKTPTDGLDQALSTLVARGFPLNHTDDSGNTLLMSAAQFCPGPVTERLVSLGAEVGPINKQNFTPLQMALVGGKWDVARVLIDHGARITRTQSDQIFMQPPEQQAQRDLLQRGTK